MKGFVARLTRNLIIPLFLFSTQAIASTEGWQFGIGAGLRIPPLSLELAKRVDSRTTRRLVVGPGIHGATVSYRHNTHYTDNRRAYYWLGAAIESHYLAAGGGWGYEIPIRTHSALFLEAGAMLPWQYKDTKVEGLAGLAEAYGAGLYLIQFGVGYRF